MRRDATILVVGLVAVAAAGICLAIPVSPWVRAASALPLVMILPGAAVLRASGQAVAGPAALALSMALSIALTALGGLCLGVLGLLYPTAWLCWLGGITLVAGCLALPRPDRAAPTPNIMPGPAVAHPQSGAMIRPRHAALCVVTLLVAFVAVHDADLNERLWRPFRITDFWMMPATAAGNLYTVGIRNGNRTPSSPFTVRVMVDGAPVASWQVIVPPDDTVSRTISLPAGHKAVAWLLRGTSRVQIYRMVSASLPDADIAAR